MKSPLACIKCRSTRITQIAKRPPKATWSEWLNRPGQSLIDGSSPKPKHTCDFCGKSKYPFYRCPDCHATLCRKCTAKAEPKPEPEPTPPPLSSDDRTKASVDQAKQEYTNRCEMIDGMVADGTLDKPEAEAMKDKAKQKMLRAIDGVMG